jgi:hypothetical protein
MIIRWQSTARWGLGVLGSLLAMLGIGFANELWAAKGELQNEVTTLKAERISDHDILLEVKEDIRELRQDAKEILRKLDK